MYLLMWEVNLKNKGIETGTHYQPIHKMSYYSQKNKIPFTEMFSKNIISIFRLALNIMIRLFVQVFLPNKIRAWIFVKFFRKREVVY